MLALEFVNEVAHTIQERGEQYGPVQENVCRIAVFATLLTSKPFSPLDIAKILVAVKLARLVADDGHFDSVLDLAGYAALWAELISEPAALKDQPTGV